MGVSSSALSGAKSFASHGGSKARGTEGSKNSSLSFSTDSFHRSRNPRKKKSAMATLKKIVRLHRQKSQSNHSYVKAFNDIVTKWTTAELSQLVDSYESTFALRELYFAALSSSPPVRTVADDLRCLFTSDCLCDVRLWYEGAAHPAHKAVLCARSSYFQREFAKNPSSCSIKIDEMECLAEFRGDKEFVHNLLLLLYTGSNNDMTYSRRSAWDSVKEQYGISLTPVEDISKMQESSTCYDAMLSFVGTCGPSLSCDSEDQDLGSYPCHQAILAARSSFFRNLLVRRNNMNTQRSCTAQSGTACREPAAPAKIVLDDAIISHRFGKLLLKVLYEGRFDLSCVVERRTAASSLSEARAIVSGSRSTCGSIIDESMELYHVGKFLVLSSLTRGAETTIVDNLTVDNVATVLAWSREPSGSDWVRRQCLRFMEENFVKFVQSPSFVSLDSESLRTLLLSDFVQAPEIEILSAVIRWSEYQLIKQREMREPNLLANTAHSITRRAFRKRDVSGAELNTVVSEFAPLIRVGHLVPATSEVLSSAVRRGITIGPLPPLVLKPTCACCPHCCMPSSESARSWILGCLDGSSTHDAAPRAYIPFCFEAKRLLEERVRGISEGEVVYLRHRSLHAFPAPAPSDGSALQEAVNRFALSSFNSLRCLPSELPMLDSSGTVAAQLLARVSELLQSRLVMDTLARHPNRATVFTLVCLWAIREAELPDDLVCMLQPHVVRLASSPCDQAHSRGHQCPWHCLSKEDQLNSATCGSSGSSTCSRACPASAVTSAVIPDVASSLSSLDYGSLLLRSDVSSSCQQRCCLMGATCGSPDVTVSNSASIKRDRVVAEQLAAVCLVSVATVDDLTHLFPDVTLHSHSGSLSEGHLHGSETALP